MIDSHLSVVDTVDTIRAKLLLNCCWAVGRNVLLLGPTASAKTMLINEFMSRSDPKKTVLKAAVGSASTSADSLQTLIESNVVHRQGYVYGAKDRKRLAIFVDDLNLPNNRTTELLRQVSDDSFLVTTKAPFEWHQIENIFLMAAATSKEGSTDIGCIDHRIMRHFTLISVNPPKDEELKSVMSSILNQVMHASQGQLLEMELHNGLVAAACNVMKEVCQVLKPAPCPGRTHYLFSVRDLTSVFLSLRRLDDDSRSDPVRVVSFWRHEMVRTIGDCISRANDGYWFNGLVDKEVGTRWPEVATKLEDYFVTIPEFAGTLEKKETSKECLTVVGSINQVRDNVSEYLTQYMEDVNNRDFDVALTDCVLEQVVRMHRLLTKPESCRLLLLAQHGFQIVELCRLSLHIAGASLAEVDTSNVDSFFADMRTLVRVSGLEQTNRAVILKAAELRSPKMWDLLNSILVSSFHHQLLSNDEMDALLQVNYFFSLGNSTQKRK